MIKRTSISFILFLILLCGLNYAESRFANYPPSTTKEPIIAENLLNGIKFDCSNKPTGPNRDSKYCDIYHACVFGKQLKTYSCPHIGERFYFDEKSQSCEFVSKNPSACPSNSYYQPLDQNKNTIQPSTQTNNMNIQYRPVTTNLPVKSYQQQQPQQSIEAWKHYVRNSEPFTCSGKTDGFYASRWCNVFYRCFNSIKSEFLCAKQQNGDRLWWSSHSTSQSIAQQSAQCQWPCEMNRQCTSPGGILKEDAGLITESTAEASRMLNSCPTKYQIGVTVQDNSNDQFRLPNTENSCTGIPDGTFISNPKYCNIFHVCFGGKRGDFLCAKASQSSPYDLWWNEATKQCEWPCRVQCQKQVFGTTTSANEIQNLDRTINSALCANSNPTYQPKPTTYATFSYYYGK